MNNFFLFFIIHLFLATLIGWVLLIAVIVSGAFSGMTVLVSFAVGAIIAIVPSIYISRKFK